MKKIFTSLSFVIFAACSAHSPTKVASTSQKSLNFRSIDAHSFEGGTPMGTPDKIIYASAPLLGWEGFSTINLRYKAPAEFLSRKEMHPKTGISFAQDFAVRPKKMPKNSKFISFELNEKGANELKAFFAKNPQAELGLFFGDQLIAAVDKKVLIFLPKKMESNPDQLRTGFEIQIRLNSDENTEKLFDDLKSNA